MDSAEISHYRIIRKLGSGGMGEVFLAEDLKLERKVAIKMLPDKWAGDRHARQRLIREAKAAAALDHPNICSIYEVGEEDDRTFIVMQYIEGENLADRIRRRALLPSEVVDIGIQACDALVEAHSHGVIHRDIKPQNAILTPRGQLKILDFGLAKFAEHLNRAAEDAHTSARLTETGQIVGTPGYMSPEQLQGQPVDERSDIFSLGVLLYECATGRSAFEGTTPIQISLRVVNSTPPPASQFNPAVPPDLDRIIFRAMAKDLGSRYESASAMLKDLDRLRNFINRLAEMGTLPLAGEPPAQRPAQPTAQIVVPTAVISKPRRLAAPYKIGIAAVVVLAGFFVFVGPGIFYNPLHAPAPEAQQWYTRGTSAIREGAYFQASRALERAVEIDPSFALARARLAEAYAETDYTDRAREELLRVLPLVPNQASWSKVDAMYVDAVGATLRRDFADAIDAYAKIIDEVSASEKSAAYVDLGRAYEKNENIDKAIECYLKATELDPQSAAGHLRLGILYGRRQELAPAKEAFGRAESIYQAMSGQEGLADVFFQRGALLARIRKLPEAKFQLERSLEISRGSANRFQSIRTQLQLSSVYYAEGDTEGAKKIAAEAIAAAQAANIRSLATNGLIDLGYTLLSRGEFAEAQSYFQQALDFARTDRAPRIEARARLALGSLNTQQSNLDEAISHLEAALAFYQPAGYRKETSNALILLGRAHGEKGEYEVALRAFTQQLELAKQSGDAAQLAAAHSSIGVLLGVNQEKYAEALVHLDDSYRINKSIGARIGMGWDQMNRATMLWQLGRYDEANAALDEAFSIANRPETGYRSQLAWVELTGAQAALSSGRYAEAAIKARKSLELAGKEYADVALLAKQTIGLAQAMSGSPRPARLLCEEAVAAAKQQKSTRLISSALLALAEVLLIAGDAQGAGSNALAAQAMSEPAGQLDTQWRAWLIAARAAQLANDKTATQDREANAQSRRAAFEQRLGADNYQSYSRRPDIQIYLRQLQQLSAPGR
ncbi:MAG: protein kinase [Acidobacteria bacterium]|nr:protein kinase [Acidobacteriota bacterium]